MKSLRTIPSRTLFESLEERQLLSVAGAWDKVFWVTNTNDSGKGSLRDAILCANAHEGRDKIGFNIAGSGVKTISLTCALPEITDSVIIDGGSQKGSKTNAPKIEITSANIDSAFKTQSLQLDGSLFAGLNFQAKNCYLDGVVINGFQIGVYLADTADGFTMHGCFLGTDPTGKCALPNLVGILANGNPDSSVPGFTPSNNCALEDIQIGNSYDWGRNLISGNLAGAVLLHVKDATIQGNLIGTDITGKKALGNCLAGLLVACDSSDVQIGGDWASEGNTISGNGLANLVLGFFSLNQTDTVIRDNQVNLVPESICSVLPFISFGGISDTTVQNNRIGTDITGKYLLCPNIKPDQVNALSSFSGSLDHTLVGILAFDGTDMDLTQNTVGGNCIGIAVVGGQNITPTAALTSDGQKCEPNLITANFIGTDSTGSKCLDNKIGIALVLAQNWTIGGQNAPNLIANAYDGIFQFAGNNNFIRANNFKKIANLAIENYPSLGQDPFLSNDSDPLHQNAPYIQFASLKKGVLTVKGLIQTTPNSELYIDVYASPTLNTIALPDSPSFIGTIKVCTNDQGWAYFCNTFSCSKVPLGSFIEATASNLNKGRTSEFGNYVTLGCQPIPV